jgi:hypothetical protein
MTGGQAPPAGAASAVILGYARLDDATVSRSLFPACLHTCKHSLHNPFMAAAAGGRYCLPCRRLTFPGKGAPVKDRTEASTGWCASQEPHVAHTRTPRSLRLYSRRREREGRRAIKTARTSW